MITDSAMIYDEEAVQDPLLDDTWDNGHYDEKTAAGTQKDTGGFRTKQQARRLPRPIWTRSSCT